MVKPFLRSGSLDDVLALGENGQPVYACAQQLRETLRLRRQQQAADCLAIPNRTKAAPASTGMRPSRQGHLLAGGKRCPAGAGSAPPGTLPDDLSQPDGTGPGDRSPQPSPVRRAAGQSDAHARSQPRLSGGRPAGADLLGLYQAAGAEPDDPLACLRPIEAEVKVEVEKPAPIAAAPRKPAVVEPVKPAPAAEPEPAPAPAAPIESPAAVRPRRRYALWLFPVLLLGSAALAAWLHRSPPQPAMPAEVQHPAPPEKPPRRCPNCACRWRTRR